MDESRGPGEGAHELTRLLTAWSGGDREARDRLFALVYDDLHQRAAGMMRREGPGVTLDASALVHETYLRLVDQTRTSWQNRAHFLAIAAQMMRRIVVDYARSRRAAKRGAPWERVSLEVSLALPAHQPFDALDLSLAIEELSELDAGQAKIVELRFFAGLSIEETAQVLESSPATVKREWRIARAWLWKKLATSGAA